MTGSSVKNVHLRNAIAAERQELAEVLNALPSQLWDTQSLCAGWRVREVVAHMTMPFRYSTPRFVTEVIKARGSFNRMADRCARRDSEMQIDELVASLRDNTENPWRPPGGGFEGALTHDVVHGLDITVALQLGRKVPEDRLRMVLDVVTRPEPIKFFGTDLNGIELRADDIQWPFGSGTPVFGLAQDLALVICGRKLPAGLLQGAASRRFAHITQ
jgi:uncharacterized protein (TIGR03083 family)